MPSPDSTKYSLSITFKSNEHPFSMIYDSIHKEFDDDAAKKWACEMAEGLGDSYIVTLLRDGNPIVKQDERKNPFKA